MVQLPLFWHPPSSFLRTNPFSLTSQSSAFQNSVYQELKAYRGSARSLPGLHELDVLLKSLVGNNQGLDNFNRADPVHVLLRTVIESAENTLEAVNLIGTFFSSFLSRPFPFSIRRARADFLPSSS